MARGCWRRGRVGAIAGWAGLEGGGPSAAWAHQEPVRELGLARIILQVPLVLAVRVRCDAHVRQKSCSVELGAKSSGLGVWSSELGATKASRVGKLGALRKLGDFRNSQFHSAQKQRPFDFESRFFEHPQRTGGWFLFLIFFCCCFVFVVVRLAGWAVSHIPGRLPNAIPAHHY